MKRSNYLRPCRMAALVLLLAPLAVPAQDVSLELGLASQSLFDGRAYLVGFPGSKTRNAVRKSFLGMNDDGSLNGNSKVPVLRSAIDRALAVRFVDGISLADDEQAQLIAWEALEAVLNGELITGNANLLRGLRQAFPSATGAEKPPGETDIPVGCPVTSGGQLYNGADVRDLCYARQYFLEGTLVALDYLATDKTGQLRYFEPANSPFEQYTYFNTASLRDPNYATNAPVPLQTAGYLLGNLLDRYGKSIVGMGDKLWRAAYFDRQRAPGGSKANERGELLDQAMSSLQQGAHAQFLAALPLAATLDEGEVGYQKCRIDQVRVTVATAASLIDRIRRGEIPKLNDLQLNSSTTDVAQQLSLVNQLYANAAAKFTQAQSDLWHELTAVDQATAAAQNLRLGLTEQIVASTAINPGGENDAPYFGLATAGGRARFRQDLYAKMGVMFQAAVGDPVLVDGSELGQNILQMRRAMNDVSSAKNRIDNVPQQIRIEQERAKLVNDVTIGTAQKISSYQFAIGFAQAFQPSMQTGYSCDGPVCKPTVNIGLTISPNALIISGLQNDIARAQTLSTIQINNANLEAFIRNKLLEMNQLVIDMKSSVAQGQLALASVNATVAKIERLVENSIYYQDSNKAKWFYDPALVFDQERSEQLYRDSLSEYVNNLYVLAAKLAVRWSEPFQNPYLNGGAIPVTLGSAVYDGFTQAESIFNVQNHDEAQNFRLALQAWDAALRANRLGGQADILSKISLRQDIFGFSDVLYNTNTFRFETNPDAVARGLNLRRFRALLLASKQPDSSPYHLRLEFPVTYGQLSRIVTGNIQQQPALILASRADWNIRMTELSAKVVGQNVAQSAFNTIRLDLYQYGKIEIPTYHPRQTTVYPNFLTFNLPLYYPDPQEASLSAFKFSLNAGINGNVGVLNPFVAQVEPTPFCDRYVLLIEKAANPPINLENIEDIELTLKSRSNIPPAFF